MINQKLNRHDFSPILRATRDQPNNKNFYTDVHKAWALFNRIEIRRLVDRAVASATKAFQLFETKEGIAIEAILHKMRHIKVNQGLKFPDCGRSLAFRWEGWFFKVMKNAAFDVIPRFLFHHERIGLDHAPTAISSEPNPEMTVMALEAASIQNQQSRWAAQFALYSSNRDLSPSRRLCHLLLTTPQLVRHSHFTHAAETLSKSPGQSWRIWETQKKSILVQRRADNQRQIQTRKMLCWLLYAPPKITLDAFQKMSDFKAKRDNFRQTAGRAAKDIRSAIALHIIADHDHLTFHKHRHLIKKVLDENRWGPSTNRMQKARSWNQGQFRNKAKLAALLYTKHGNIETWRKHHPTLAQNKITRFLDRLNRIQAALNEKQHCKTIKGAIESHP